MLDSQQLKRSRFLNIPLQWVIVVPFVVQVASAVGLVGYLSYHSGQQAVENIIYQLLHQTSERVSDRLDNYLHTPQQVVAINSLAVKQKLFNLDNTEQLRKQLWQQIQLNPSLVSNGFWGKKNMAISYVRLISQEFQNIVEQKSGDSIPLGTVLLHEASVNYRRFYAIDGQGNPTKLILDLKDDFRLTPWYIDAQKFTTQSWTPISFGRVIPLLQIVAISPVYDQQKQLNGFFNTQYFLSNISLFLNQLKFTPTGQVFIIERSGNLVATSVFTEESGLKLIGDQFLRLNATDSQDPITREVARQLKQKFGNFENFKESQQLNLMVANLKKFVQVNHYQDGYGLDWYVVTVIPEADFTSEIRKNVYHTAILCGLALLGSVSIGILTSRRIARSLSHLTIASRSFADKHLAPDLPYTHIAEVQILSEAMQHMMRELKEADQLRLSYAKDLEQQVAEKTAALTEAQRIARMGSWEFDVVTGTNIWSEAQFQILGFDPTLPLPKYADTFALVPEEDRPKMLATVEEAIANGTPYMVEHGLIRPDGSICYVISRGEPVFDEQGKVIKLVGTIVDVSDRKQIELELIAKEAQFQELATASPSVIYTVVEELNGPTRFEFVSPAFSEIHERSLADVYQNAAIVFEQIHPDDLPEYLSAVDNSLKTMEPFHHEWRIITPSGKTKWLQASSRPSLRVNGEVAWHGVVTDISDRKHLEQELIQSRNLRELIFNESSDALFLVNPETVRTIDCNQRAVTLFEVEHKSELIDIEGHTLQKRRFTPQELERIDQEINQKSFWTLEVEYVTRKGREFWGDLSVKQISFGTQKFNLMRVVDITDRKQIAITLAKAKLAAEEATRAKSEFLASMSHEIRTPMNGIIGMTQLLQTTPLNVEQQDFVKTIKDSGDSLLMILNDILDFSKIESQKLELESKSFHLEEVVMGICKLLERQTQEKGIALRYAIAPDTPNTIIGDRLRLRQVLLNLVGNALKFTEAGQVLILVNGQYLNGDNLTHDRKYQLKFEIVDTGIGIPSDRIDKLFQPFTQADASISRKYGGTGLGLSISKRLVELMGGTIWVESLGQVNGHPCADWQPKTQLQGSTFHFTITVSHDGAIASNQGVSDLYTDELLIDQTLSQKFPLRILLVEDNKVNQMIANKLLDKLGYAIDIVNNGQEALQAIKTQSYDLIFMDLQMPEMDGLTATKLIRKHSPSDGDYIQIVAMTANAMEEDRQICLDAGMDDYVSKPINIQQLIDILSKTYRKSHPHKSI